MSDLCRNGHPWDGNTYHAPSGQRVCRLCTNAAQARYDARKKAGIKADKRAILNPNNACLRGHEFTPKNTRVWRGKRICRACRNEATKALPPSAVRDRNLKSKYGLDFGLYQFDALLAAQGNACAICETSLEDRTGFRRHVDHCHSTGRVRGILCPNCNTAIGKLKDDPNLLRRALAYLER